MSLNHPPGEITHLVAEIHEQQFSLEQEADEKATMHFSWTIRFKTKPKETACGGLLNEAYVKKTSVSGGCRMNFSIPISASLAL